MEPKKALSSSSSRRRRVASFSSISAGGEIGVDGHLLAGDGIEGEARADLGDARRALGDDQEVDRDQDDEHDRADDEVAAHDEVGEAGDDVAGGVVALVRRCDRMRRVVAMLSDSRSSVAISSTVGKAEKSSGFWIHSATIRISTAERDREGEPDVDQERRQRQEQHRQDEDDADGEADVLGAVALDRLDAGCNRGRHRFPSRSRGGQFGARTLREGAGAGACRGLSPVSSYPRASEQTERWIPATPALG